MGDWLAQLLRGSLMAAFLVCSAIFSGTETAFFSLSPRQVKRLRQSSRRLPRLAASLLERPSDLLGALLLGNLLVNTLYFAVASVLMTQLKRAHGVPAASAVAVGSFVGLILFGEILPKSFAYAAAERVCTWVAVPTFIVVRVLSPIALVFRWGIAEPVLRLLLGPHRHGRQVTSEELKTLIERVCREEGLSSYHGRLFREAVDFNLLRVRHVMRPRVDIPACPVQSSVRQAKRLMLQRHVTQLAVYEGDLDHVIGRVTLRDCFLHPGGRSVRPLLRPVAFVPEQKTVESLLQFFRKMRTDTVMVVDEYGGLAGMVEVEDLAEELVGPLDRPADQPLAEAIGPFTYRLSGDLPLHDWADLFGGLYNPAGASTLGGWVTSRLGRVPRSGDRLEWEGWQFEVETVTRHRVDSLILRMGKSDG